MAEQLKELDLSRFAAVVDRARSFRRRGRVVQAVGLSVEVEGLPLQVGEICQICSSDGGEQIAGEVVGFRGDRLIVMPFAETSGVGMGSPVYSARRRFSVPVGDGVLGRVVDGLCRPIDGKGPLRGQALYNVDSAPPSPLGRRAITSPLETGVRAIDGPLTCGLGQRIGIFAGSGVGKSTLLGMIARNARSDVNVIGLIGERGREVQEFIERDLGPEGLERSVVVVSTSDQPPLQRLKGAQVATAIAEFFRDQGCDVTLMMDSVTRFAMAQREVGLAAGEPPTTRGYPPSVFALLPRLMERAGTSAQGTITGFYTILVEGDDLSEPIADTVRSVLDGHIVLTRRLANEGHFPAIAVLESVSRVMPAITDEAHRALARQMREVLSTHAAASDLINIGAYVSGSSPAIDRSILLLPKVKELLQQSPAERSTLAETRSAMRAIFDSGSQGTGVVDGGSKFRLETLLEHRRRQEEARQLELTTRQRRLDEEQRELMALDLRRESVLAHLHNEQTAPVLDLSALDRSFIYTTSLESAIAAQQQVIAALVGECDAARDELIQASRASKVVTKLREGWEAECRREELRLEDKTLAETAIAQYHRRKQPADGA